MNENNNEQEQPLYKEQPWWVQIFVALYAMFWLTMIFAAGLNSLYIGKIDIDSVSMAVALTVGIYPWIKMLEKLYDVLHNNIFVLLDKPKVSDYN